MVGNYRNIGEKTFYRVVLGNWNFLKMKIPRHDVVQSYSYFNTRHAKARASFPQVFSQIDETQTTLPLKLLNRDSENFQGGHVNGSFFCILLTFPLGKCIFASLPEFLMTSWLKIPKNHFPQTRAGAAQMSRGGQNREKFQKPSEFKGHFLQNHKNPQNLRAFLKSPRGTRGTLGRLCSMSRLKDLLATKNSFLQKNNL